MKTKLLLLLLTLVALGIMPQTVMAQIYEAYPLSESDSVVQAYVYKAPTTGKKLYTPANFELEKAVKIPRGAQVKLKEKKEVYDTNGGFLSTLSIDPDKRPLISVEYEGTAYYADCHEWKFSSTNPEGTEDPIAKFTDENVHHFFNGKYLLRILLFICLTWLCSIIASKIGQRKAAKGSLKPHNPLIAVFLLLAVGFSLFTLINELVMAINLRQEAGWWLNSGYVGDWKRLLNIFLLYLAMRWQYSTISYFGDGLEYYLYTEESLPRNALFKTMVKAFIFAVVVAVIGLILNNYNRTITIVCLWIAGIVPIILIVFRLVVTFLSTKQSAGWLISIGYTLFVILWSLGMITMVGFFIWQLIRIIIPFIILTIFFQMTPAFKVPVPSTGMKFYDSSGGVHDSVGARDLRNQALESYK